LTIYSSLALLIACFGLFGMSMMLYYQKSKEISIRKILGASFTSLIRMLLTDFTKLVLISIAIGFPVTWYLMSEWLKNFSFQVGISPLVFVSSGLVLLLMAWGTLSYFTIKASRINPAETLKNE
jgi:putative ABC transport system permease protein